MSGINFDYILDKPGERHIEPDKNEEGVAYGKAIVGSLKSGELGQCICIAAYDPNGVGYMAHIDLDKSKEEFRNNVQRFTTLIELDREDESLEDVRFLLGGSCHENPFIDNKESRISKDELWKIGGIRITAEDMLKRHSVNIEVNWGAKDGYYSELVLNTDKEEIFFYDREKTRINPDK